MALSLLLTRLAPLGIELAHLNQELAFSKLFKASPQSLRDAVRVATRDSGAARLARRGRMAQEISDIVLVYVRQPESGCEGAAGRDSAGMMTNQMVKPLTNIMHLTP